MRAGEWSRSRFWLSYFLNSRHARPRVPDPTDGGGDLRDAALSWLAELVDRPGLARSWVVRAAGEHHPADPAFVQCLRLIAREQQHHHDLVTRISGGQPTPVRRVGRDWLRPLGVRFRLALQMLHDLLDVPLLHRLAQCAQDPALRTVAATLLAERQMHVAFTAEWLAAQFADFSFLRRNLRRWRVRGLFLALLAPRLFRHEALRRRLGLGRRAWAAAAIAQFERLLEQMVPYRRDELLALLTQQRDQPYDRPRQLMP